MNKKEFRDLINICVSKKEFIRFGSGNGWYDTSYYYLLAQGMYNETMLSHWCNTTNDSILIPELNNPIDLFEKEIVKVKNVLNEHPDVMITHVCPVSEAIAFPDKYKNDRTSGYYCFDGLHLIDPVNNPKVPKFWIHGHIHSSSEFKIYETTHLRNPLGYPGEIKEFELKTFEI